MKQFEIMQKMVDDNSSGIAISTTITDSNKCHKGGLIEFGVESKFANDATIQRAFGMPGDYMIFAVFVSRKEYEKYKNQ